MHDLSLSVSIRQATITDAQAIAEIHIRSWQWAYQSLLPQDYLDRMVDTLEARVEARRTILKNMPPQTRWWIAEQTKHVVGWAITEPSRDTDVLPMTAEVCAIYLAPEAIGKGIGRRLFAQAVADLRERGYERATLWVLEGNTRAQKFYASAGWAPDGTSQVVERPGVILHEVRYSTRL